LAGGSVLHWGTGAGGRGVLCSSDIATVTTDRKFLTFMRSYPNLIPLSAKQVSAIAAALEPFAFDTIYGHYFDRVIPAGGKEILAISVQRYVAAINGKYDSASTEAKRRTRVGPALTPPSPAPAAETPSDALRASRRSRRAR